MKTEVYDYANVDNVIVTNAHFITICTHICILYTKILRSKYITHPMHAT